MGKLKIASVFSGCGGMDLGALGNFEYLDKKYSANPVEIVYAIDNDQYACEIYNSNFQTKCINKDIRDLKPSEIPPHHVMIGGFPCQPFSIASQNPRGLGCEDPQGQLFFEMSRLLRERKPLCFVAENVKGLLSSNHGKAFQLILDSFGDAAYHVTYAILNASDYGVPQNRERVFIVGFREPQMLRSFKFPKPSTLGQKISLADAISPEAEVDERYYFSEKAVLGMERARNKIKRAKKNHTRGRVQDPNKPCNTLSAHLSQQCLNGTDPVLKVGGRYRRFTPREVARIQSFPDDFILTTSEKRQYRALGNAICPVVMWRLTREVVKAIKKTDKKVFKSEPFRTPDEIRSFNMSRIRSKNTSIELVLRKALWAKGYRYVTHYKGAQGKPDIAFKSIKLAIFCDSAFWHGKDFDKTLFRIKTRKAYWAGKIGRNIERDREVNDALKREGWDVLRFWDVDIENKLENIVEIIESHIKMRSSLSKR